jgi:hypothetical protein
MVQRLARSPFKVILVTPDKGLAVFSITYSRLEWVGGAGMGYLQCNSQCNFTLIVVLAFFGAMRLSFVRRDGTGRRNRLKICRVSLPVKVDSFHRHQKLHRPHTCLYH